MALSRTLSSYEEINSDLLLLYIIIFMCKKKIFQFWSGESSIFSSPVWQQKKSQTFVTGTFSKHSWRVNPLFVVLGFVTTLMRTSHQPQLSRESYLGTSEKGTTLTAVLTTTYWQERLLTTFLGNKWFSRWSLSLGEFAGSKRRREGVGHVNSTPARAREKPASLRNHWRA